MPLAIDPAYFSAPLLMAGAASIFAAAVLRGVTGFGFAIAAVPLLSLTFPPAFAVPLVVCLQLFGNLFEIRASVRQAHWPSLTGLMFGALAGTPLGMLALAVISPDAARLSIAAATALAVAILAPGIAFKSVPGAGLSVPAGLIAGVFNGLAAMPGPPAIAYYLSSPVTRASMRASLNVFFLANAAVAAASAFALQLVSWTMAVYALIALPVMFAGQRIGLHFFDRGSDRTHRRIAIACLAVLALGAAVRGLSGFLAR